MAIGNGSKMTLKYLCRIVHYKPHYKINQKFPQKQEMFASGLLENYEYSGINSIKMSVN